jgi:hypothetical protein
MTLHSPAGRALRAHEARQHHEDIRKYAAEKALDETVALEHGMQQKAAEFQHSGAEIYSKP